jgi:hypothetical protein
MARYGTFRKFMTSGRRGDAANIQQWLTRRFRLLKPWTFLLVLSCVIKMNLAKHCVASIGAWQDTAVSWRRTWVIGAPANIQQWLQRRFPLLEPLTLLLVLLHLSKREVAKFGLTSISA